MPATDHADTAHAIAANHAVWDAWTPHHIASGGYDIPGFIAGRETLCPITLAGVGDVNGKTLLHLQCHFGLDTLSWARHGALVTGVDFVESAIAKARELAAELALPADFVCCDVYDAPRDCSGNSTSCSRPSARCRGCRTWKAGRASSRNA